MALGKKHALEVLSTVKEINDALLKAVDKLRGSLPAN